MNEDQEYIYEMIVNKVRMGFDAKEVIQEMILEQVEDEELEDEVSEDWINETVAAEFKKVKQESKTWSHPTDPEKLAKAFDELCAQNIIALHNAGFETSDGEQEVVDIEIQLRDNGKQSDGYCFYHEQDLERAIDPDSKNLMIAFQKINNSDDAVTLAVGKIVAAKLREHGFTIRWNENPQQKIEIVDINWHKQYNEDDEAHFEHARVLDLL